MLTVDEIVRDEKRRQRLTGSTSSQLATIDNVTNDGITIIVDGQFQSAGLAFSCLVQPLPGDTVLASSLPGHDYVITAIVSRPGEQLMQLRFPEGASFSAPKGHINLVCQEGIGLNTPGQLTLVSKKALHSSDETIIRYRDATASGDKLHASIKSINVVSEFINQVAKQVFQRFTQYIRRTTGHEQIRAGQSTQKFDGMLTMDSTHVMLTSQKDMRIDGERIHMG